MLTNIFIKYIEGLIKTIESVNVLSVEYIKQRYNYDHLYFEDTLEFALKINLVVVDDGSITYASTNVDVKTFIIQAIPNIVEQEDRLREFLNQFTVDGSVIKFSPKKEQIVYFTNERRFLSELGVLKVDKQNLVIDELSIIHYIFLRELPLNKLQRFLESNAIIGELAENLVLDYERYVREKEYTNIPIEKIIQISHINVNAGYDIKSFDKIAAQNGLYKEIYIEVKAVPERISQFYWSKNEIDVAKDKRNSYFLFLVHAPFTSNDFSKIEIIQDPYINVYLNNNWKQQVINTFFTKSE